MLLAISFFVTPWLYAQQDPQFTQNMFNQFSINPAYAGSQGQVCFTTLARQQWMGFDGSPATQDFGIHTPFKLFGAEHGVGLTVQNDKYLFNTHQNISLSYAYRFEMGKGKLGLGGRVGYHIFDFNPTWKYPYDVVSGGVGSPESVIPDKAEKINLIDYSVGAFYNAEDAYLGLSVSNLTNPELKYQGTAASTSSAKTNLLRHIYVSAGYYYQLPSNPLIVLAPSFFMMTYGQGTQLNFNLNVIYNDKIWGGLSYRVNDALSLLFGFQLYNGLKIGGAYDLNLFSPVGRFSSGSMEFLLSYSFSLKKEKVLRRYKSVRFL